MFRSAHDLTIRYATITFFFLNNNNHNDMWLLGLEDTK
jgi:hypothetical protein